QCGCPRVTAAKLLILNHTGEGRYPWPRWAPASAGVTKGSGERAMRELRILLAAGAIVVLSLVAGGAAAQSLRIGLAEDPDVLDPTLARTFVGRIVFASLCDKLVDISPELEIVPQLAVSWQWTDANRGLVLKLRPGVKFHDGEAMDA